ncbi:hypothetical protein [Acinetobacter guerrae]|uniref:hypothetical protein n=1 Tax=Acinetobacter guerrae TaxID=1843371 RepID=UPI00125FF1F2|nr:hypothetical protein [Acinetobacter guerrae]
MAFGGRVFSANKTLQIDERYNNLYLIKKQTYSLSATGQGMSTYLDNCAVFTSNYAESIIAVSTATVNSQLLIYKGNGNDYYITAKVAAEITVYEFGKLTQAASYSKYGIRVVRLDGTVSFDSTRKPMRVVDSINYNIDYQQTADVKDVSIPNGKTYAFAVSRLTTNFVGFRAGTGGGGIPLYGYMAHTPGCIKPDSSTLRIKPERGYSVTGSSSAGVYDYGKGATNGFIIDVTNY